MSSVLVRISADLFIVEIQADAELHPDLLDEMCSRAVRLFVDTQATMAEGVTEEGEDA